jgi:hypothetical protein
MGGMINIITKNQKNAPVFLLMPLPPTGWVK